MSIIKPSDIVLGDDIGKIFGEVTNQVDEYISSYNQLKNPICQRRVVAGEEFRPDINESSLDIDVYNLTIICGKIDEGGSVVPLEDDENTNEYMDVLNDSQCFVYIHPRFGHHFTIQGSLKDLKKIKLVFKKDLYIEYMTIAVHGTPRNLPPIVQIENANKIENSLIVNYAEYSNQVVSDDSLVEYVIKKSYLKPNKLYYFRSDSKVLPHFLVNDELIKQNIVKSGKYYVGTIEFKKNFFEESYTEVKVTVSTNSKFEFTGVSYDGPELLPSIFTVDNMYTKKEVENIVSLNTQAVKDIANENKEKIKDKLDIADAKMGNQWWLRKSDKFKDVDGEEYYELTPDELAIHLFGTKAFNRTVSAGFVFSILHSGMEYFSQFPVYGDVNRDGEISTIKCTTETYDEIFDYKDTKLYITLNGLTLLKSNLYKLGIMSDTQQEVDLNIDRYGFLKGSIFGFVDFNPVKMGTKVINTKIEIPVTNIKEWGIPYKFTPIVNGATDYVNSLSYDFINKDFDELTYDLNFFDGDYNKLSHKPNVYTQLEVNTLLNKYTPLSSYETLSEAVKVLQLSDVNGKDLKNALDKKLEVKDLDNLVKSLSMVDGSLAYTKNNGEINKVDLSSSFVTNTLLDSKLNKLSTKEELNNLNTKITEAISESIKSSIVSIEYRDNKLIVKDNTNSTVEIPIQLTIDNLTDKNMVTDVTYNDNILTITKYDKNVETKKTFKLFDGKFESLTGVPNLVTKEFYNNDIANYIKHGEISVGDIKNSNGSIVTNISYSDGVLTYRDLDSNGLNSRNINLDNDFINNKEFKTLSDKVDTKADNLPATTEKAGLMSPEDKKIIDKFDSSISTLSSNLRNTISEKVDGINTKLLNYAEKGKITPSDLAGSHNNILTDVRLESENGSLVFNTAGEGNFKSVQLSDYYTKKDAKTIIKAINNSVVHYNKIGDDGSLVSYQTNTSGKSELIPVKDSDENQSYVFVNRSDNRVKQYIDNRVNNINLTNYVPLSDMVKYATIDTLNTKLGELDKIYAGVSVVKRLDDNKADRSELSKYQLAGDYASSEDVASINTKLSNVLTTNDLTPSTLGKMVRRNIVTSIYATKEGSFGYDYIGPDGKFGGQGVGGYFFNANNPANVVKKYIENETNNAKNIAIQKSVDSINKTLTESYLSKNELTYDIILNKLGMNDDTAPLISVYSNNDGSLYLRRKTRDSSLDSNINSDGTEIGYLFRDTKDNKIKKYIDSKVTEMTSSVSLSDYIKKSDLNKKLLTDTIGLDTYVKSASISEDGKLKVVNKTSTSNDDNTVDIGGYLFKENDSNVVKTYIDKKIVESTLSQDDQSKLADLEKNYVKNTEFTYENIVGKFNPENPLLSKVSVSPEGLVKTNQFHKNDKEANTTIDTGMYVYQNNDKNIVKKEIEKLASSTESGRLSKSDKAFIDSIPSLYMKSSDLTAELISKTLLDKYRNTYTRVYSDTTGKLLQNRIDDNGSQIIGSDISAEGVYVFSNNANNIVKKYIDSKVTGLGDTYVPLNTFNEAILGKANLSELSKYQLKGDYVTTQAMELALVNNKPTRDDIYTIGNFTSVVNKGVIVDKSGALSYGVNKKDDLTKTEVPVKYGNDTQTYAFALNDENTVKKYIDSSIVGRALPISYKETIDKIPNTYLPKSEFDISRIKRSSPILSEIRIKEDGRLSYYNHASDGTGCYGDAYYDMNRNLVYAFSESADNKVKKYIDENDAKTLAKSLPVSYKETIDTIKDNYVNKDTFDKYSNTINSKIENVASLSDVSQVRSDFTKSINNLKERFKFLTVALESEFQTGYVITDKNRVDNEEIIIISSGLSFYEAVNNSLMGKDSNIRGDILCDNNRNPIKILETYVGDDKVDNNTIIGVRCIIDKHVDKVMLSSGMTTWTTFTLFIRNESKKTITELLADTTFGDIFDRKKLVEYVLDSLNLDGKYISKTNGLTRELLYEDNDDELVFNLNVLGNKYNFYPYKNAEDKDYLIDFTVREYKEYSKYDGIYKDYFPLVEEVVDDNRIKIHLNERRGILYFDVSELNSSALDMLTSMSGAKLVIPKKGNKYIDTIVSVFSRNTKGLDLAKLNHTLDEYDSNIKNIDEKIKALPDHSNFVTKDELRESTTGAITEERVNELIKTSTSDLVAKKDFVVNKLIANTKNTNPIISQFNIDDNGKLAYHAYEHGRESLGYARYPVSFQSRKELYFYCDADDNVVKKFVLKSISEANANNDTKYLPISLKDTINSIPDTYIAKSEYNSFKDSLPSVYLDRESYLKDKATFLTVDMFRETVGNVISKNIFDSYKTEVSNTYLTKASYEEEKNKYLLKSDAKLENISGTVVTNINLKEDGSIGIQLMKNGKVDNSNSIPFLNNETILSMKSKIDSLPDMTKFITSDSLAPYVTNETFRTYIDNLTTNRAFNEFKSTVENGYLKSSKYEKDKESFATNSSVKSITDKLVSSEEFNKHKESLPNTYLSSSYKDTIDIINSSYVSRTSFKSSLDSALSDYVTKTSYEDKNSELTSKIDTKLDKSEMSKYSTTESIDTKLSTKLDKSEISKYTTTEDLNKKLSTKLDSSVIDNYTVTTEMNKQFKSVNDKIDTKLDKSEISKYQLAGDYVTNTDLTSKLSTKLDKSIIDNYTTTEDLNTKLNSKLDSSVISNYTTTENMDKQFKSVNDKIDTKLDKSEMSKYSTTKEIDSKLATKLDSSVIANYTTTTDMNKKFSTVEETFSTKLNDYSTTESIDTKLSTKLDKSEISKYETTESINSKLASKLDSSIISNYTTTEDMNAKFKSLEDTKLDKSVIDSYTSTTEMNKQFKTVNDKIDTKLDKSAISNYTTTEDIDKKFKSVDDSLNTKLDKSEMSKYSTTVDIDKKLDTKLDKSVIDNYTNTKDMNTKFKSLEDNKLDKSIIDNYTNTTDMDKKFNTVNDKIETKLDKSEMTKYSTTESINSKLANKVDSSDYNESKGKILNVGDGQMYSIKIMEKSQYDESEIDDNVIYFTFE